MWRAHQLRYPEKIWNPMVFATLMMLQDHAEILILTHLSHSVTPCMIIERDMADRIQDDHKDLAALGAVNGLMKGAHLRPKKEVRVDFNTWVFPTWSAGADPDKVTFRGSLSVLLPLFNKLLNDFRCISFAMADITSHTSHKERQQVGNQWLMTWYTANDAFMYGHDDDLRKPRLSGTLECTQTKSDQECWLLLWLQVAACQSHQLKATNEALLYFWQAAVERRRSAIGISLAATFNWVSMVERVVWMPSLRPCLVHHSIL